MPREFATPFFGLRQRDGEELNIPAKRRSDPFSFFDSINKRKATSVQKETEVGNAQSIPVYNSSTAMDRIAEWRERIEPQGMVDNTDVQILDEDFHVLDDTGVNDNMFDDNEATGACDGDSVTLDNSTIAPEPMDNNVEQYIEDHRLQEEPTEDPGFIGADGDLADVQATTVIAPDTPLTSNDSIPHIHQTREFTLTPFMLAAAIWVEENGISRQVYTELMEVLRVAGSLEEIQTLPDRKDTLIAKYQTMVPRPRTWTSTVKLDPLDLGTRSKQEEDMVAVDLADTVRTILSSDSTSEPIYRGMAQLTDKHVTESWQARWWGESIRSTSGQFHQSRGGSIILPSDFVKWEQEGVERFGRVTWCGIDCRAVPVAGGSEATAKSIVRVQHVVPRQQLPDYMARSSHILSAKPLRPGCVELLICETEDTYITPDNVISVIGDVFIDYDFDPFELPQLPKKTRRPKVAQTDREKEHQAEVERAKAAKLFHSQRREGRLRNAEYVIRYVYNGDMDTFRAVKSFDPHRGELEINAYGREYLINKFASDNVISLPFQLYSDGFGIWETTYHSLMGMYLFPLFYPEHIRARRQNALPLSLGPYGAIMADVFKAIIHLRDLDGGIMMKVGGKDMFVCPFVAYLTGDMPQQQKMSGCKLQNANLGCRRCKIHVDYRHDLGFDIVHQCRTHYEVLAQRRHAGSLDTISATREFRSQNGLDEDTNLMPVLMSLFPALDIICTRPTDPAHSEFAGLSRVLLSLLLQDDGLLTAAALDNLNEIFQIFQFPPGWARLQSFRKHIGSWRMQEFARAAIITPVLFRCWLRAEHIKPELQPLLKRFAADYLEQAEPDAYNYAAWSGVSWTVLATWTFARSVLGLFGRSENPLTKKELTQRIIQGRRSVQYFCQVLGERQKELSAKSTTRTTRARAVAPQAAPVPPAPTASNASVATSRRRQANPDDKGNAFLNKKRLPNIHVGLHLPEVIEMYGCSRLVDTLWGESKHSDFKEMSGSTNRRDMAPTLMNREIQRQSTNFAFAGCFEESHPDVHDCFQVVRDRCPELAAISMHIQDSKSSGKDDSRLYIAGDKLHSNPLVLHSLPARFARLKNNPLLRVVRLNDTEAVVFKAMLSKAYDQDYGIRFAMLGNGRVEWALKFSWTDPYRSSRRVFAVGDFVEILPQEKGEASQMGRIDGVCIHTLATKSRMFAVITVITPRATSPLKEPILDAPIYELTTIQLLVGLSRISTKRSWVVRKTDGNFMIIPFDVYFM